jgi:NADH-quinone oxidoreductase subunit G
MSIYTLPAAERVRVEVDGVAVEVPANYNLIQACKTAGVYLPHYCWHPSLSVPANCRLCLVKCENAPGVGRPGLLVAGCHARVMNGMKIITQDADVADSRQGMMEFLLANHPLDCPQCDRGGECELQRYSMDYGASDSRFAPNKKRRFPKPDFDALIDIERNRCILCTRCTRFCAEVASDPVMGVFGRGDQCYIGTFGDGPVSNIYSGNTIDICPVGCLTNKPYRFQARPWELRQVSSVCMGCSSGCSVTYWMRSGEVMRTTPPARASEQFSKFTLDSETVDFICNQGRFASDYGRHESRTKRAIVRGANWKAKPEAELPAHGAEVVRTEAALDAVADKLKQAAAKGRAAVLLSSRLTNEEYLAAQHLAKVALGTNNIDWRTRLPHREAADALSEAMALSDGGLEKIHQYSAVLLVGGSAQQVTPLAALEIKEAARRGQTSLIVAGARVDKFFAEVAKASFVVEPGREGAWLEWLAGGAQGDTLPEWSAAWGGDAKAAKAALSNAIAGGGQLLLVYDPTSLSGLAAGATVGAVQNLVRAFGERLHTLPLLKDRNATGAFLAGAQPDRLPFGPAKDERAAHRWQRVAGAEKVVPEDAGLTGPEILAKAAAGQIDALFIVGGGDALDPHPFPGLVEEALAKTPFVAITELLDGPVARRAHVLLPAANFYEKEGSLLNVEGQVGRLAKAESPEGDARSDFDLLRALCEKLGSPFPFETPAKAFQAWRGVAEEVGAIETMDAPPAADGRVVEPPFNFARRGAAREESKRVFLRRREALNGFRPQLGAVAAVEGDGLVLVWDEHIQGHDHYMSRAGQADILAPVATVEIHPADAEKLELSGRDEVNLSVGDWSAMVRVVISEGVRPGAAYVGRNVAGLDLPTNAAKLPRALLKPAAAEAGAKG